MGRSVLQELLLPVAGQALEKRAVLLIQPVELAKGRKLVILPVATPRVRSDRAVPVGSSALGQKRLDRHEPVKVRATPTDLATGEPLLQLFPAHGRLRLVTPLVPTFRRLLQDPVIVDIVVARIETPVSGTLRLHHAGKTPAEKELATERPAVDPNTQLGIHLVPALADLTVKPAAEKRDAKVREVVVPPRKRGTNRIRDLLQLLRVAVKNRLTQILAAPAPLFALALPASELDALASAVLTKRTHHRLRCHNNFLSPFMGKFNYLAPKPPFFGSSFRSTPSLLVTNDDPLCFSLTAMINDTLVNQLPIIILCFLSKAYPHTYKTSLLSPL